MLVFSTNAHFGRFLFVVCLQNDTQMTLSLNDNLYQLDYSGNTVASQTVVGLLLLKLAVERVSHSRLG